MIYGQCPECQRPLLQEYANGGWRYLACMGGHAWRSRSGKLFPRVEETDAPDTKQVRMAWCEHEVKIPEQEEHLKWLYGG